MKSKVIFLDIDGTLINFSGYMKESTISAIQQARKNGHKIIICTGRCKYQIYPELFEMGIDGLVAAAGAYVEYHEKKIFQEYMSEKERFKLSEFLNANNLAYSVHTETNTIMTKYSSEIILPRFTNAGFETKSLKQVLGTLEINEDMWDNDKIIKVLFFDSKIPVSDIIAQLESEFTVTVSSMETEAATSGEIGINGIDKSTGMQNLLDYIHMSREDSIAVGDGPNDFEMLEFAGTGIAMGNAIDELKKTADYVTANIDDDGIYKAFKKYELI